MVNVVRFIIIDLIQLHMASGLDTFQGKLHTLEGTGITIDETVVIIEDEYAITSPRMERPVLKTKGVGDSGYCWSYYLLDESNRIGALTHVTSGNMSFDNFEVLLRDLTACGAEKLILDYVGEDLDPHVLEFLLRAQTHLQDEGRLVRPVTQVPLHIVAMDTRNSRIFGLGPHELELNCVINQRPYAFQRYGPSGGPKDWSCAYPITVPIDLKSPE
jgi:hypothetical protein|tara:strand:- start:67 stop:714 length:648 start_codon:yes stop_codon:yes gene_type:complete